MLIAFLAIQLQGTLYNYYYVILRNSVKGDSTSRIFETTTPKALNGESQLAVNIFTRSTTYFIFLLIRLFIVWIKMPLKVSLFPNGL